MKYFVFILSVLFLISCQNEEEKKRNIILFEDSIDMVKDTIIKMNHLMDKLPFPEEINKYCSLEEKILEVNGQDLGNIDQVNLDTVSLFIGFTEQEKREFISTVLFLDKNHLTSTYRHKSANAYSYAYRTTIYDSFKMSRTIFLKNDTIDISNYKTLFPEEKILDQQKGLILLGYRSNR